jgi:zinc transport system ATP-binding protein
MSSEKTEEVIRLKDVWVSYNHMPILEDVNLSVERGDYLAILGPNGGGKTTLLKAILGLVEPSRGIVEVLGRPPSQTRHRVGYIPQVARYDKDFPVSVWDVVLMGRLSHRGSHPGYSKDDKRAAEGALRSVDMLDLRNRQIDELSGGQRQRVFIARALSVEPEILLLDEPTSSVDTRVQTNLYDLLGDLNMEITIVLVTHDLSVISSRVSRVACLNHRLIVHDEKQLSKEDLEETYLCPVELIAHGLPHRVFEEHE